MYSRDGKGNPGKMILKNNQPNLKLSDVLRRRRSTLSSFMNELGITTYTSLCIWCKRMGMSPPTQKEFEIVFPAQVHVNSPQEGVIVIEPLEQQDDAQTAPDVDEVHDFDPTEDPVKKHPKKKGKSTKDD